jgi:hypothetical protein
MTRYTAHGKQVLRGSEHVADAADATWAQIIADALNGERVPHTGRPLRGKAWEDAKARLDGPEYILPRRYSPIVQPGDKFTMDVGGQRYEGIIDPKMPPDTIKMQGVDHATRPDQTVWSMIKQDGPEYVMYPYQHDALQAMGIDYASEPDKTIHMICHSAHEQPAHVWQRQQDEYACSCGARWSVEDGDTHP